MPTGHGRAQPSLRNFCASDNISTQRAALWASPARACRGVQRERFSCGGTLRCGALSLIHLVRTLCLCVKMAAMVRTWPGGLALQAAGLVCVRVAGGWGADNAVGVGYAGGAVMMRHKQVGHAVLGGESQD